MYFSESRSCIVKPEIPGCDEGILEDRRRAKSLRGKELVAGFEDCQINERGIFLARTSLASREIWYAADAVRFGTRQVKLRENR